MFVNKPLQSKINMAIEITFGIKGKETTQALFIQESEWEIPLAKLRRSIEDQSLYVPLEYKFLTLKDNAIAHPAEENIVLREVVSFVPDEKEEAELKLEDFGMASEIGEAVKKTPGTPKIWITPLKITFSSASPNSDKISSGTNAAETDGECADAPLGEDEPLLGNESDDNGQQQPSGQTCSSCPYRVFIDFVHGKKGPPNPRTVFKVVFLLTFILFTLLATLTLSMHLMVSSFTSLGKSPAMMDFFSKIEAGHGGSSETVTKLQIKLSQLEMSTKYEIDQLTSRLAELEDLYLNDLAIHKKELNLIKKQMAEDEEQYAEEEIDGYEETSRNSFERNSKEPKRKSGKINERNKG